VTTAYKLVFREADGALRSLVPGPYALTYPIGKKVRMEFGRIFCYLDRDQAGKVISRGYTYDLRSCRFGPGRGLAGAPGRVWRPPARAYPARIGMPACLHLWCGTGVLADWPGRQGLHTRVAHLGHTARCRPPGAGRPSSCRQRRSPLSPAT
jgi:hypothetical protein